MNVQQQPLPRRRPIHEQRGMHRYPTGIRRAIELQATMARSGTIKYTTEETPPASRSYAGKSAAIHPEDMPTTELSELDFEEEEEENEPTTEAPRQRWNLLALHPFVFFGSGMTLMIGGIAFWIFVLAPALQWANDQYRYGTSRVNTVCKVLLAGDTSQSPTCLVGIEQQHRLVVIVFPGAHPGNAETLTGPYVTGDGHVVSFEFQDVNGDGTLDAVVHVEGLGSTWLLFNTSHAFQARDPQAAGGARA